MKQAATHTTLARRIRRLEENIVTLSGPALATSGIVAGVDILTNSILARTAPVVGEILGLVWAVCLMLTLDFQVLTLGVRASRIYATKHKRGLHKIAEMLLCCLIAAAIAYVSLQMGSVFARMLGTTMTLDEAQRQLGINPIALIYERSAMVMLLIFMSGWLRDSESDDEQGEQPQPQPAPGANVQAIAQQTPTPQQAGQLVLTPELVETLRALFAQTTISELPQEAQPTALLAPVDTQGEQGEQTDEQGEQPQDNEAVHPLPGEPEKPERGEQHPDYSEQIAQLYRDNPAITITEIEELVGCSRSTASKWLKRMKPANEGEA